MALKYMYVQILLHKVFRFLSIAYSTLCQRCASVPFIYCIEKLNKLIIILTMNISDSQNSSRRISAQNDEVIALTLFLLEPNMIGLCQQYTARPACTSMKSDQALYCWLTSFKFSS